MKKNVAIVLGISSNLTFSAANVLMQLKTHSPNLADDIIIFHDGIDLKDQKLMKNIINCKFIEYKFPIEISKFNEVYFNKFTHIAYSRLECLNLLDEYKNVIWLDTDILIQKDISELLNYSQTGIAGLHFETLNLDFDFLKPIEKYNLQTPIFAVGTVVVSDNLPNYKDLAKWCYQKSDEYAEYFKNGDQAIFNLMLQEFKLTYGKLDFDTWACQPTKANAKDAYILHPAGNYKFWNFFRNKEWNKNYKTWVKIGGSKYKGRKYNFFSRIILSKYQYAPDPSRHFGKFIKYFINELREKRR